NGRYYESHFFHADLRHLGVLVFESRPHRTNSTSRHPCNLCLIRTVRHISPCIKQNVVVIRSFLDLSSACLLFSPPFRLRASVVYCFTTEQEGNHETWRRMRVELFGRSRLVATCETADCSAICCHCGDEGMSPH